MDRLVSHAIHFMYGVRCARLYTIFFGFNDFSLSLYLLYHNFLWLSTNCLNLSILWVCRALHFIASFIYLFDCILSQYIVTCQELFWKPVWLNALKWGVLVWTVYTISQLIVLVNIYLLFFSRNCVTSI